MLPFSILLFAAVRAQMDQMHAPSANENSNINQEVSPKAFDSQLEFPAMIPVVGITTTTVPLKNLAVEKRGNRPPSPSTTTNTLSSSALSNPKNSGSTSSSRSVLTTVPGNRYVAGSSSSTSQIKSASITTQTSSSPTPSKSSTITTAPTSTKTSTSSSTSRTSVNTCAPSYTNSIMITGTGTLPKPTAFVKRATSGQGLTLSGSPFRVVGANIYWLCNDENVQPNNFYTDKGRVREGLAIAVAMGANTVRLTSCGVSVGSQYSVEPSLNTFGTSQWDIHDYVIFAAGQYGLRVILPLTDDYDFYYGSKYTYLRFEGVTTGNYGNAFYTNPSVIADFKTYITTVLTHKNVYTGITYGSDSTILAWETGNELGAYIGREGYPPASWTSTITALLKQYAPSTLTLDGTDGFYNYTTKATAPGLTVSTVDIVTDHGYPRSIPLLNSQIPIATNANKAFLIGEYDWTNSFGGDSLASYLQAIESTSYIGDLIWNVQGHDAQCCNYVTHNDGYSLYYPNGPNTVDQRANILLVVQHFYRMTGRAVPATLPGVACPQKVF